MKIKNTRVLGTAVAVLVLLLAAAAAFASGGGGAAHEELGTKLNLYMGIPFIGILLSIALLLVGGGLFPPVIGIVGGVLATRINASLNKKRDRRSGPISRFFALMWPWPLVAFFIWLFGQFVIGYFFNTFLIESGFLIPILILGLMIFSIVSGFAYDAR